MKRLSLLTFAAVIFGSILSAQPRALNTFTATCTLVLTGAAKACTIQQPAQDSANLQLVSAYVDSTVAVSVSQERNGAAATTTAVVPRSLNPEVSGASRALVYTDSNVGAGTPVMDAPIKLAANASQILDLQDIQLRGSGTTKNYTIRTSAVTGTVTVVLKWREY